MKRIGVDTGGTFTDSVLWDEDEGLIASAKISSNRADPSKAVVASVEKLGNAAKHDVSYLIHGTTVATNATLERTGPRVGTICTAGFRDVLEIARLTRSPEQIYDLRASPAPPLISRRDRLEVSERIDHIGAVNVPVDESSVVQAARTLARRGINSIAICLLHSYLNPSHERGRPRYYRAGDAGCEYLHFFGRPTRIPGVRAIEHHCSQRLFSADRWRIFAPFERVRDSLERRTRLWVMQSNGGVASAERTAQLPVTLLLSGPSGGVVAGRYLMDQAATAKGITIDMGGN